jgi:hypothetical protein
MAGSRSVWDWRLAHASVLCVDISTFYDAPKTGNITKVVVERERIDTDGPIPQIGATVTRVSSLSFAAVLLLAACDTPPPAPVRRLPPTQVSPAPAGAAQGYFGAVTRAAGDAASNACEPAVSKALRTRYPQPGAILLMPDREKAYQYSELQTGVNGEGTFEPDNSETSVAFRYTCIFNTRSNRVDDVRMLY